MSLTPATPIACILMFGGGPLTGSEVKWFFFVVGAIMLAAIFWDVVAALVKRARGRNWPTISAVIDNVNVTFFQDKFPRYALDSSHYKVTLTYIYNSHGQQMGDYSRDFGNKEDAEAWANSYKGETVKVHVDPRDPTRSVLREEDL